MFVTKGRFSPRSLAFRWACWFGTDRALSTSSPATMPATLRQLEREPSIAELVVPVVGEAGDERFDNRATLAAMGVRVQLADRARPLTLTSKQGNQHSNPPRVRLGVWVAARGRLPHQAGEVWVSGTSKHALAAREGHTQSLPSVPKGHNGAGPFSSQTPSLISATGQ